MTSSLHSQQIVRKMKAGPNYINMSALFRMVQHSVIWNGLNYCGSRVYIPTDSSTGEVHFLKHQMKARTKLKTVIARVTARAHGANASLEHSIATGSQ
jgi:hypothetical protein